MHDTCKFEASSSSTPGVKPSTPLYQINISSVLGCLSIYKISIQENKRKDAKIEKVNYFQRILFLIFFSISPIPSRTFVMSYILLFWTYIIRNISLSLHKKEKELNGRLSAHLQCFSSFIQIKDAILCMLK